jgi:ABC-2 type transport system ATP-binding protein
MHDGRLVAADTVEALRETAGGPAELVCTVDASPDDVAAALAPVDGVGAVTGADGRVRVACERPAAKAAVVARLDAAGITVRDLAVEGASLEGVFTALTGGDGADARGPSDPTGR